MADTNPGEEHGAGDGASSLDAIMPAVYAELRRIAHGYMQRERPDHTLQPTALVNEVYVRLAAGGHTEGRSRAQFLGLAASVMRHVLIDYAAGRNAQKRSGRLVRVSIAGSEPALAPKEIDLIDLDRALTELAALDPRQARVVELRFFGGLTIDETAEVIGVSTATVEREWATARLWLLRRVRQNEQP